MDLFIEFVGGPMDGKKVTGTLGQQGDADRYFALTHHGRVGQRFRTASPYAIDTLANEALKETTPHHFQQYLYEVVERREEQEILFVRVEYSGGTSRE